MMEKTRMHAPNGCRDARRQATTLATTSDQPYCRDPPKIVAKVVCSLDEELTHDKLIEKIMCAFSGIPSTAAAINELSCIHQQPGQNLLIYINKYRDLHWWCTKKLPREETYKLTLSQFCSSLQDPIGRKLCWETMGQEGMLQAIKSTEMLWWGHQGLQVIQSDRAPMKAWNIQSISGNQWNYLPTEVQLWWTMLQQLQ